MKRFFKPVLLLLILLMINPPLAEGSSVSMKLVIEPKIYETLIPGYSRIFITSTVYDGHLRGRYGETHDIPEYILEGKDRANLLCQDRAEEAGLGGYWQAFMSSPEVDMIDLVPQTMALHRLDCSTFDRYCQEERNSGRDDAGQLVAKKREELFQTGIMKKVNITEGRTHYRNYHDGKPWTGLKGDGTKSGKDCNNWDSASSLIKGTTGSVDQFSSQWISNEETLCHEYRPLLCIEDFTPEDVDWLNMIDSEQAGKFHFEDEMMISEIELDVKNDVNQKAYISVEQLNEVPKTIPPPDNGVPVKFFELSTSVNNNNVEFANIHFSLPPGIIPNPRQIVVMHRFNTLSKAWEKLPTKTSIASTTTMPTQLNALQVTKKQYEATSPGFSTFSIILEGEPSTIPYSSGTGRQDAGGSVQTIPLQRFPTEIIRNSADIRNPEIQEPNKINDKQDETNGVRGKNGSNGKNGTNGKNGLNGKDISNGKNGRNGKNGIHGKNETSGTNGTNESGEKNEMNEGDEKNGNDEKTQANAYNEALSAKAKEVKTALEEKKDELISNNSALNGEVKKEEEKQGGEEEKEEIKKQEAITNMMQSLHSLQELLPARSTTEMNSSSESSSISSSSPDVSSSQSPESETPSTITMNNQVLEDHTELIRELEKGMEVSEEKLETIPKHAEEDFLKLEGKTVPFGLVTIEINSPETLQGAISADHEGIWSWKAPKKLSKGVHTNAIMIIDPQKKKVIAKNTSLMIVKPQEEIKKEEIEKKEALRTGQPVAKKNNGEDLKSLQQQLVEKVREEAARPKVSLSLIAHVPDEYYSVLPGTTIPVGLLLIGKETLLEPEITLQYWYGPRDQERGELIDPTIALSDHMIIPITIAPESPAGPYRLEIHFEKDQTHIQSEAYFQVQKPPLNIFPFLIYGFFTALVLFIASRKNKVA